MYNAHIKDILKSVDELKQEFYADGVKIYFKSADDYNIKLIKDERLIRSFRRHNSKFDELPPEKHEETTNAERKH